MEIFSMPVLLYAIWELLQRLCRISCFAMDKVEGESQALWAVYSFLSFDICCQLEVWNLTPMCGNTVYLCVYTLQSFAGKFCRLLKTDITGGVSCSQHRVSLNDDASSPTLSCSGMAYSKGMTNRPYRHQPPGTDIGNVQRSVMQVATKLPVHQII